MLATCTSTLNVPSLNVFDVDEWRPYNFLEFEMLSLLHIDLDPFSFKVIACEKNKTNLSKEKKEEIFKEKTNLACWKEHNLRMQIPK